MSTYEELMVILTIAMLIVAILNYTQKKQPSSSCDNEVRTATIL